MIQRKNKLLINRFSVILPIMMTVRITEPTVKTLLPEPYIVGEKNITIRVPMTARNPNSVNVLNFVFCNRRYTNMTLYTVQKK